MFILKTKATKILYSIFFALFLVSSVVGQSEPYTTKFPASPSAAALSQYVDVPVSYYSGLPSVSVPLYEINTGGFSVPISLSYHASGVKVAQEASNVGLGWSLNAGGMITREIRGVDDFKSGNFPYGYFQISDAENPYKEIEGEMFDINVCHGLYHSSSSTTSGSTQYSDCHLDVDPSSRKILLVLNPHQQVYDGEPDIFRFNFLGYSGKFIIQRNAEGIDTGVGVLVDNKNKLDIKLTFEGGSKKNIIIKDEQGITYEFTENESSRTWSSSGPTYNSTTLANGGIEPPINNNGWFLTKIILTNGETIDFNYKSDGTDGYIYNSIISSSAYKKQSIGYQGVSPCLISENLNKAVKEEKYFKNFTQSRTLILDNITWKNGVVKFKTSGREDLDKIVGVGRQKIDKVEVFPIINSVTAQTPAKSYTLAYDYFNKNANDKRLNWRLKLLSVTENSIVNTNSATTTSKPVHTFKYNNTHSLPSKESNSFDHWGYYNGTTNLASNILPGIADFNLQDFMREKTRGFMSALDLGVSSIPDHNFYEEGADRTPSEAHTQAGVLTQITYPTGAVEDYEYELNEYNRAAESLGYQSVETKMHSHSVGYVYGGQTTNENPFGFEKEFVVTNEAKKFDLRFSVSINAAYELYNNNHSTWGIEVYKTDVFPNEFIGQLKMPYDFVNNNYNPSILTYNVSYLKDDPIFNKTLLPGNYKLKLVMPEHLIGVPRDQFFMHGFIDYEEAIVDENNVTIPEVIEKVGGLRIKRITNDKNTREFYYNLEDGKPSGILLGEYNYYDHTMSLSTISFGVSCSSGESKSWSIVKSSNSNTSLTGSVTGNVVGYSRVEERIINNENSGEYLKAVYSYSNYKEPLEGRGIPRRHLISNGLLLKKEVFENSNTTPRIIEENNYGYVYRLPIKAIAVTENTSSSTLDYIVFSDFYPLKSTKTTENNYDNGTLTSFSTEKEFYFNDLSHSQPREILTINSKGDQVRQKIYYPIDPNIPISYSNLNKVKDTLVSQHRMSTPMFTEVQEKKKGAINYKTLQSYYSQYKDWGANTTGNQNLILPEEVKTLKGSSGTYIDQAVFHKYDSNGNVLSASRPNGIKAVYIYGYNKEYPIAVIENASYEDVAYLESNLQTLANKDNDSCLKGENCNEDKLRTALDNLRSTLPNAQVTTYTYDPLVGVTSVTDPRGYITYYKYDDFNRLKQVVDYEGHILSENEYNYQH